MITILFVIVAAHVRFGIFSVIHVYAGLYMEFKRSACECDVIRYIKEGEHSTSGSSGDYWISASHEGFLKLLRAIPAETKVDGLPRAVSYVCKNDGEQYQGETICKWLEDLS